MRPSIAKASPAGRLLGLTVILGALALVLSHLGPGQQALAAPDYRLLGQPELFETAQATRCPDPNARFNFLQEGDFEMHGPSGIAIDSRGRLFVTDFGGKRVLTWPNVETLTACQAAD